MSTTDGANRTVRTFALVSLITLLAGISCGPPPPGAEHRATCRPEAPTVEAGDGAMTIAWKVECPQLISGYNIYISEQPLTEHNSQPFNATVYPGDTDPDDGVVQYDAQGLDNGVRYYVSVRVVFPDQSLSAPSDEVAAVCGPRGEIELATRYSAEQDGYSFAQNQYVRADDLNNDLYFYSKGGTDYLASPIRLDGFLRNNRFMRLSVNGDLETVKHQLASIDSEPGDDRVAVREGDWVWIVTTEGHHALVQVRKLTVEDGKGTVVLSFAYWPIEGPPVL